MMLTWCSTRARLGMLRAVAAFWLCGAPFTAAEPLPSPEQPDFFAHSAPCALWLDSLGRCATASGAAGSLSDDTLPNSPEQPNWAGLRRDTVYFLGLQFSIIGVLYLMPESVSSWTEEDKEEYSFGKWWDNVTNPAWDKDDLFINYVLHPYWGATYYVRGREQGLDSRGAFWYSVLLSSLYEFGAEAFFEPVSIQDVIVTPIVGSWIGGYFMDWREQTYARMSASGQARFRDKALLVATDPLGSVADLIDRAIGRDVSVNVRPFAATRGLRYENAADADPESVYGITVQLRW